MSGRPRWIFSSVKFKWGLFWQVGEIFVHLNERHSELRIWQECPGSLQGLSGQQRAIVVDQTGLKGLFYLGQNNETTAGRWAAIDWFL